MERRLVLAGLAAAAVSPALAQPAAAPAMKMGMPTNLSDAARNHIERTRTVGSLSLVTSRIAAPKVKVATLRQFTGFEIAEQETIASILKAMMSPGAPITGTVAVPTDAELTGNLDDKGKAIVEKLRAMKAGVEFERAYVRAQIAGHKELLAIQEAYLKTPDSLDETNVAKLAKGMIEQHLTLLSDIAKQIG